MGTVLPLAMILASLAVYSNLVSEKVLGISSQVGVCESLSALGRIPFQEFAVFWSHLGEWDRIVLSQCKTIIDVEYRGSRSSSRVCVSRRDSFHRTSLRTRSGSLDLFEEDNKHAQSSGLEKTELAPDTAYPSLFLRS